MKMPTALEVGERWVTDGRKWSDEWQGCYECMESCEKFKVFWAAGTKESSAVVVLVCTNCGAEMGLATYPQD